MPTAPSRPLFLLAALFAPLGVIAPKVVVPLLALAASWMIIHRLRSGQLWRPFRSSAAIPAAAIIVWALASAFWALDPQAALITVAKLAAVLLSTLLLVDGIRDISREDHEPLRRALIGAFAIAAILLVSESLSGAAAHKWFYEFQGRKDQFDETVLNRAEAMLFMMAWTTALVVWQLKGGLWGFAPILAAIISIGIGVSNSSALAMALSLICLPFAHYFGVWFLRGLAVLVFLSMLAAPLLPGTYLSPDRWSGQFGEHQYSALHRLHIWEFTAERIAEAPILGWGMDASRRIPGGDTKLAGGGNVMSVHPHNASLQIWLELGAIGAVLAAMALAALFWRASTLKERYQRAAAAGLLVSALALAHLSFGIWQTWWMAALALNGAMFAMALQLKGK